MTSPDPDGPARMHHEPDDAITPGRSGPPFARLMLQWAAVRTVLVLLLLLPANASLPGDLKLFVAWSQELADGRFPAGEFWQYPPGFALVLVLVGSIGVPALGLVLLNLAADLGILWRLRGGAGGRFWALAPLCLGPIMLVRLDTLSTWAAVVGLGAAATWRSGLWLGIGASLKAWPAFLVVAFPWPAAWRRALAVVIVLVASAAMSALLLGATDPFVGNQQGRGLQVEAVAAWPFLAARAAGAEIDLAFRNGAIEVDTPLADAIARGLPVLTLLCVLVVALVGWRRRLAAPDLGGLLVVLVMLTTSRVLSPQFGVWMIGLLAVVVGTRRTPRTLVVAVLGSALASQAVYPYLAQELLVDGTPLAVAVQGLRLALLVVALVLAAKAWTATEAVEPRLTLAS